MSWLDGQVFNAPAANAVLFDTGAVIPEGDQQLPAILVSSTSPAVVLLQHRNAANAVNLHQHAIVLAVDQTLYLPSLGSINCQQGERLRAVLFAAIAGRIQVSFFT